MRVAFVLRDVKKYATKKGEKHNNKKRNFFGNDEKAKSIDRLNYFQRRKEPQNRMTAPSKKKTSELISNTERNTGSSAAT